jgi:hypothetical protein
MTSALTQARLMEVVSYDPTTGIFIWKIDGRWKVAGERAGFVAHGYRRMTIDGRQYRASHLAWLYVHGKLPTQRLDHRDRDTGNDRIKNLRPCTHEQNMANRTVFRGTSSGAKGVYANGRQFMAIITAEKKRHYLGLFPSIAAAKAAYDAAAKQLHGEFACS